MVQNISSFNVLSENEMRNTDGGFVVGVFIVLGFAAGWAWAEYQDRDNDYDACKKMQEDNPDYNFACSR